VGEDDDSIENHSFGIGLAAENFQNGLPYSGAAPTFEPREYRYPRTEGFRQIPPGCSSPMLPENGFDEGTIGKAWPAVRPSSGGSRGASIIHNRSLIWLRGIQSPRIFILGTTLQTKVQALPLITIANLRTRPNA